MPLKDIAEYLTNFSTTGLGQFIIALGAIFTFIITFRKYIQTIFYWIWRHILHPIKKFFTGILKLPDQVDRLHNEILSFSHELKMNGGTSMLDAIKRIEVNIRRNSAIIGVHSRAMHIARWESDKNGLAINANDTLLRLTGRTFSELQNMNWTNIYPERERERIIRLWEISITQRSPFEVDSFYIRPDDTEIPVHIYAEPIVPSDRETGWIGYAVERSPKVSDKKA